MKKCVQIKVSGRVQGVNFRYNTQKAAASYHIGGFVKNLPDGRVLIEAEAEEEDLIAFLRWVNKGPSWAKVEKAEVEEIPCRNYSNFQIRH